MAQHIPSRRDFLKGAGVVGASTLFAGSGALAAPSSASRKAGHAKNLIFLVVDGMGQGTLGLAHHWQLRNRSKPLEWTRFYDRPEVVTALQDTASASSPVTDSAAAGSAWGCGKRVDNRAINFTADGKALDPIYRFAKDAGKATGLVSTCRITHATPASFAANVPHRDSEDDIARQYLEREIDVILGGGQRHFAGEDPSKQLLPEFKKKGYRLAGDLTDLNALKGSAKLLGAFTDSHIPYAIDRENDRDLRHVPGLEAMFEAALQSLSGAENGFVLQVEGGRVDHAGHGNDPVAILHEQLEFDRCIAIAEAFVAKHPDTLLILTTDHGTAGCQLNGLGDGYNDSGPALDRINRFNMSFEAMADQYKALGKFDPDYFEKHTGFRPSVDQIAMIQTALEEGVKYLNNVLTKAFADELFNTTGVGWSSTNHTAEHVELLALGPGADIIPPFLKNYELHGIMREVLGI